MNILYVDDEKDLLELASSFFDDENVELETSHDFHEALELVRSKKYDLIITDVRMPDGSGLELIAKARQEGHFSGKFILVSGDLKSQGEATIAGCDLVMSKPLDFLVLIKTVKKLLQDK